jgi:hypothetical protein
LEKRGNREGAGAVLGEKKKGERFGEEETPDRRDPPIGGKKREGEGICGVPRPVCFAGPQAWPKWSAAHFFLF